jgi:hypothetical protein
LLLQSGLPWFPNDVTSDITGTGEFGNSIDPAIQTWNYTGPASAFKAGATAIPCYYNPLNGNSPLGGCTAYNAPGNPYAGQVWAACEAAAVAPYAAGSQQAGLALAALNNLGCYAQGNGILTPPAFGTIGNATRNMFRQPGYRNVDLNIAKEWKFKEKYSAQFRAEFFNIFNWTNYGGITDDPEGGAGSTGTGFGCVCSTPDVAGNNPVLGSGGPRHIQFGLKLSW